MRYLVLLLAFCCTACKSTLDERFGEWNACISPGQFAGDRIKRVEDGRAGTVVSVYGPSFRCKDARRPTLAEVNYE